MFKLSLSAVAAALLSSLATSAFAGECPADKFKPGVREMVKARGGRRHRHYLGSIDLEKQPAKIKGRELRFRKLVIQPGGIVPWHSHDDRPALIYIAEGEIIEYASNCGAPISTRPAISVPEVAGTSHWWKNLSEKPAVLFVGDVRRDPHDKHM